MPLTSSERIEISDGQHPCPEYLHYIQTYSSTLLDWNADILPLLFDSRRGDLEIYDNFIAGYEDVGLGLASLLRGHGMTQPVFVITHGLIYENQLALSLLSGMEGVYFLCLSEQIAMYLTTYCGIPDMRVRVIGYCADLSFFDGGKRHNREEDLIVSAGTANRDYKLLLEVCRSIPVRVEIAADSAWHRQALNVAHDELPETVHIGSCETYLRLRELYSRASVVVVPLQPARYACGYAVISEAMAMAKAVITTKVEGRSDFVIDGVTGYYVGPGDEADMRAKVEYLLRNPKLALEMGKRGRERMEERFSLSQYVDTIHRVICEVTRPSSSGPADCALASMA
jgi:glycosyltransferase involved in cell wall biosynthesis